MCLFTDFSGTITDLLFVLGATLGLTDADTNMLHGRNVDGCCHGDHDGHCTNKLESTVHCNILSCLTSDWW